MTTPHPAATRLQRPDLTRLASGGAAVLAYVGELGLLAGSAVRAIVWTTRPAPALAPAVLKQLDELFARALPLTALVFVPMGSFLSMQAFFHATFTEAVGAVVGLGLVRNLAPLLAGMVLAPLLALQIVPELRREDHAGLDGDDHAVADRDVTRGLRADDRPAPEPARLAAVRVLAAAIAAPTLAIWGTVIGLLVGMLLAQAKLSVAPGIYVGKLAEMVHSGDAVGLVGKSVLFGLAGAVMACQEGLRGRSGGSTPRETADAVFRAVCLAFLAILVVNACWFTLEYLSGPPFGPSLAVGSGG